MTTNNRKLQGILEATGCEFKMSFKAAELSYKEDNKKFGECGRKSYTNLTGKDLELELASKMQSCKLDLAVFVQGFKELVEKSCEPDIDQKIAQAQKEDLVRNAKAHQHLPAADQENYPALYLPANIENYSYEYLRERIEKISLDEFIKWEKKIYKNRFKEEMIIADEETHKAILARHGMNYKLNRLRKLQREPLEVYPK